MSRVKVKVLIHQAGSEAKFSDLGSISGDSSRYYYKQDADFDQTMNALQEAGFQPCRVREHREFVVVGETGHALYYGGKGMETHKALQEAGFEMGDESRDTLKA